MAENLEQLNQVLTDFAAKVNGDQPVQAIKAGEPLKVGVDLGTSSIVLTVLTANNRPVYGAFEYANAVRDGIVVNYMESVQILKRLKEKAESVLGVELTQACGAIPPGTGESSQRIVANVIEAAGFECWDVVDEPTAAGKFLRVQNGTVVDIGGGTTGISVFAEGKLVKVIDEPTGGTHMTLVLAGYHHLPYEKAELLKRDAAKETEVFPIIRPVVEKMAMITKNEIQDQLITPVYVVGGTTNFTQFETVFTKTLGVEVLKPAYPQFVTPLGIGMYEI